MPSTPENSAVRRLPRRSLLAGLGAAAGVGLAVYGTQFSVPDEPEQLEPERLGATATAPDVWNTAGNGLGNRRHAPVDAVSNPTVAWSAPLGARGVAVADGTVFLTRSGSAAGDSRLVAAALDDGTRRWTVDLAGYAPAPGWFEDGLYVTSGGRVHALDGDDGRDGDGRHRWEHDLYGTLAERVHEAFLPEEREEFQVSTPVVADGVVHLRSSFGLHGIDAATGEERWRLWTAVPGVDLDPGGDRWRQHVRRGRGGRRRPLVASEGVYFAGPNGDSRSELFLVRRDESDGLSPPLDEFCPPPALGRQHVLAGPAPRTRTGRPATLYGVDGSRPDADVDGETWAFVGHRTSAPHGRETTVPAVGPDRVYVGDVVKAPDRLLATVYGLDPASGLAAWAHPVELQVDRRFDPPLEPVVSVPTLVDGTLYVGLAPVVDSSPTDPEYVAREAGVLALDAETGERRWFQRFGFLPRGMAAADGALLAWDDRRLTVLADAGG